MHKILLSGSILTMAVFADQHFSWNIKISRMKQKKYRILVLRTSPVSMMEEAGTERLHIIPSDLLAIEHFP